MAIVAGRRLPGWAGPVVLGTAFTALFYLERRRPLRPAPGSPAPGSTAPIDTAKAEPYDQRVWHNLLLAALVAAEVHLCERPLVTPLAQKVVRSRLGLLPKLGLPRFWEAAAGVILLDYSLYWWHVMLHRVPFLWRSHVVHHTDLVLDTTTALRFHAWEFAASIPYRMAQVRILGVTPTTLALWQRLTLLEVLFHHSNLRLSSHVERWLSHLIVTPRLHGIHHSVKPEETHSNFSSGLTVWDKLHHTWRRDVPQKDIEIGVPAYHRPEELRLVKLLRLPFIKQKPSWQWQSAQCQSSRSRNNNRSSKH